MSKKILFTILIISLLLVGCANTDDDAAVYENEISQLTEEVTELKKVVTAQEETINSLEDFSFLNDFSEFELNTYDLFLEEYDVTHLKDYSPEKIVLLYFHSLAIGDVDTIHAIAFDDGTLPDLDSFRDKVNSIDQPLDAHDVVITYRNYDSIEIREEHKTEDSVNVEMAASAYFQTSVIVYNVKKENDQWKMNIQHLFEEI